MLLDPPPTGCRCGGCSPTLDCAEAPLRTAGPPGRTSFRPRAKHRSNLGSQGRELHWLMEATITMHLGWAPPKLYPNFPGFLSCNVLRVLTCPPTPKNLLRTLDQGAERSLAPASPPAACMTKAFSVLRGRSRGGRHRVGARRPPRPRLQPRAAPSPRPRPTPRLSGGCGAGDARTPRLAPLCGDSRAGAGGVLVLCPQLLSPGLASLPAVFRFNPVPSGRPPVLTQKRHRSLKKVHLR